MPALLRGLGAGFACPVAAACPLLARTTRTQQRTRRIRRHTRRTAHEGGRIYLRTHVTGRLTGRAVVCFLFFRKQSSVQKQRTTHEAGTFTRAGRARSRDTEKRIGLSGPSGGGSGGAGERPPPVVPAAGAKKLRCAVREARGFYRCFSCVWFVLLCVCEKRKGNAYSRAVRTGSGCVTM